MSGRVRRKFRTARRYRDVEEDGEEENTSFLSEDLDDDLEIKVDTLTYGNSGRCILTIRCVLLAWSATLTALCIVIGLLLSQTLNDRGNVCLDSNCVEVAGRIIAQMNLSVDPCDDFYEYACGNWPVVHPPSASYGKWSAFQIDRLRNQALLKTILDDQTTMYMGVNSTSVGKVKRVFRACMNMTRTHEQGNKPLLQLIRDMGSWSLTSDDISGRWDVNSWNLLGNLIASYNYGSPLFMWGLDVNKTNSSTYQVFFDQSGLFYSSRDFYLGNNSEKYHKAEVDLFVSVVDLLRSGSSSADSGNLHEIRQQAEAVWQFERQLAEIQVAKIDRINPMSTFHPVTIEHLQNVVGDWLNISTYNEAVLKQRLPSSYVVMAYGLEYLSRLKSVVNPVSSQTLQNYIVWQVVSGFISYMPAEYQTARLNFHHTVYGVDALEEHWKTCVKRADSTLPYVTSALYTQKYFSQSDKDFVSNMLVSVHLEFVRDLPNIDWMDIGTQKAAIEKANGVRKKIGFPELALYPAKLDVKYDKLIITDDAFKNALTAADFNTQENLAHLGKAVDRAAWGVSAVDVNAFYDRENNEMFFPAGILQPPFYSSKHPRAVNYGAIGFAIGHELTHAFDNTGRYYDVHGNLADWWGNKSAEQFTHRTKCMVDQYSKFMIGGSYNNGRLTLGENIADNAGLKYAYKAYNSWLRRNGGNEPAASLPGLNLNQRQLFFVATAQEFCAYETPAYAKQALTTDPHSHFKFRVRGMMANSQDFATAYQCPQSSPANPPNKCSVW